MAMLAEQTGANRVVTGTKIPYPLGDPTLPEEADKELRRGIVRCTLKALQADVSGPTIFVPETKYTAG